MRKYLSGFCVMFCSNKMCLSTGYGPGPWYPNNGGAKASKPGHSHHYNIAT